MKNNWKPQLYHCGKHPGCQVLDGLVKDGQTIHLRPTRDDEWPTEVTELLRPFFERPGGELVTVEGAKSSLGLRKWDCPFTREYRYFRDETEVEFLSRIRPRMEAAAGSRLEGLRIV